MLRAEAGLLEGSLPIGGGPPVRERRQTRLDIEIERRPQGFIVRLDGDAGILEAEDLDFRLMLLVGRRPDLVVFDLSNLGYVSSVTLGLLVSFRRALLKHGGRVRLAGVQPLVREILHRAGLTERFEVASSVDAALVAY